MRRLVARFAGWFLLALALLALCCWKLDALRTPQVLCISPGSGVIDGVGYECVLPMEAMFVVDGHWYLYTVEDSNSYFHPVVARRIEVTPVAQSETLVAVQGAYMNDLRVVRFASRPLEGDTVSVQVWEEGES